MQHSPTFIGEMTGREIPAVALTDRERFMSEKLLDLAQCLSRTSLKRSQFYELVSKGAITQPCKIGRSSRWPESEIQQYIAELKNARTVH